MSSPSSPNHHMRNDGDDTATTTATTPKLGTTASHNHAVNPIKDGRGTVTHVHQLRLLASTLSTYQSSIATSHLREYDLLQGWENNSSNSQHNDQLETVTSDSKHGLYVDDDGGHRKLPNGIVYTLNQTIRSPVSGGRNSRNGEINGGERGRVNPQEKRVESNCFRTIEWTPDGTSLVTTGEDNVMRVFVVSPNLLSPPTSSPLPLSPPYCVIASPSTIHSHAIYPFFDLSNPSTTLVMTSTPAHPLQLRSCLTGELCASYPLYLPDTEKWLSAGAMCWTGDGGSVMAGGDGVVYKINVERDGEGINGVFGLGISGGNKNNRNKKKKRGNRGRVSAMDMDGRSGSGLLAVGTWRGFVGCYDEQGSGEEVMSVDLRKHDDGRYGNSGQKKRYYGTGVTKIKLCTDGRRLVVAERKSEIIRIFDLRMMQRDGYTSSPCQILQNRVASTTNQRMGVDVGTWGTSAEEVVVGGGEDGIVGIWKLNNTHDDHDQHEIQVSIAEEGDDEGSGEIRSRIGEWKAANDPIGGVAIHPTGCVVATCSGTRKVSSFEESDNDDGQDEHDSDTSMDGVAQENYRKDNHTGRDKSWDNAVKIWQIQ